MSLRAFYLSQVRMCEMSARVSTDPKLIQTLHNEAERYRALAAQIGEQIDPYQRSADNDQSAKEGDQAPRQARRPGPEG